MLSGEWATAAAHYLYPIPPPLWAWHPHQSAILQLSASGHFHYVPQQKTRNRGICTEHFPSRLGAGFLLLLLLNLTRGNFLHWFSREWEGGRKWGREKKERRKHEFEKEASIVCFLYMPTSEPGTDPATQVYAQILMEYFYLPISGFCPCLGKMYAYIKKMQCYILRSLWQTSVPSQIQPVEHQNHQWKWRASDFLRKASLAYWPQSNHVSCCWWRNNVESFLCPTLQFSVFT